MRRIVEGIVLLIAAFYLMSALIPVSNGVATPSEEVSLRSHVVDRGERETGALNLVTAIYLGYRAFDTFGETVVLLLSVSGVLFLVKDGR